MLIYNPSAQVAQALVWEEIRKKKTMKRTDIQLWARSSDEYHTCSAAINNYESESESRSVVSDSLRPMECIVHGILQARILEWAAFPFSRRSSQPRNRTQVSCIAGGFFTGWATKSTKQLLSRISQQIFRVWFLQESKHKQWALCVKLLSKPWHREVKCKQRATALLDRWTWLKAGLGFVSRYKRGAGEHLYLPVGG